MKESQGKNLEAETDVESMEECYLKLFPHSFLSLLSYTILDHKPRGDSIHSGLNPTTSIINQKNALKTYLLTR